MAGINKPNFEPQEIKTQKNPEITREKITKKTKENIGKLGNEIFRFGNTERFPPLVEGKVKYYSEKSKTEFDDYLKNILPINKVKEHNLEVA